MLNLSFIKKTLVLKNESLYCRYKLIEQKVFYN